LNCQIEKSSLIEKLRKEYETKILQLKLLLADKPVVNIHETINNYFTNLILNETIDIRHYFEEAFINFNFSHNFKFEQTIYESIRQFIIQPSILPYFSLLSLNLLYQQNTNINIRSSTVNIIQNSVTQIDFTNINLTKEEIFYTLNYIIEHPSITSIKWGENKLFQNIETYLFSLILPMTNIQTFDFSQIGISEETKLKIINNIKMKQEPIKKPPEEEKPRKTNETIIFSRFIDPQGVVGGGNNFLHVHVFDTSTPKNSQCQDPKRNNYKTCCDHSG